MRQAWDLGPFAALLQSLHLDTPLLELQNTKKLYGTKNNCVHAQWGQILDPKDTKGKKNKTKQNKTQLPFLQRPEQKLVGSNSLVLRMPPSPTPRHAPTLPLIRNELAPPPRGSEQGSLSLVLAASCSQFRDPSEALPEFLVWPLVSFYGLGKAKDPGRYQNSPKILRKKL